MKRASFLWRLRVCFDDTIHHQTSILVILFQPVPGVTQPVLLKVLKVPHPVCPVEPVLRIADCHWPFLIAGVQHFQYASMRRNSQGALIRLLGTPPLILQPLKMQSHLRARSSPHRTVKYVLHIHEQGILNPGLGGLQGRLGFV